MLLYASCSSSITLLLSSPLLPHRRLKRAKEKAQQRTAADVGAWGEQKEDGGEGGDLAAGTAAAGVDRLVAGDELESSTVLRLDHRVRSFDFSPSCSTVSTSFSSDGTTTASIGGGRDDEAGKKNPIRKKIKYDSTRILVALHNNSMEVWGLDGSVEGANASANAASSSQKRKNSSKGKSGEEEGREGGLVSFSRVSTLDLQGHRTDVRAVAVSSDGSMVASVSHGLVKAWSSRTRQCVRSVPCGFGLSVVFAPGDRHLLLGTKEGNLQVPYEKWGGGGKGAFKFLVDLIRSDFYFFY